MTVRAIVVSYSFPPVGGAGVQRVLKLVKYLPSYGVEPTVLTVKNPSVPLSDASLARDVPPSVQVLRARTLEPGYRTKELAWQAASSGASWHSARACWYRTRRCSGCPPRRGCSCPACGSATITSWSSAG